MPCSNRRRIIDPPEARVAEWEASLAAGQELIVQFSRPSYDAAMLQAIEALCARFGAGIEVRFYAHGTAGLDCRVLRALPSVRALVLDCLLNAAHFEEIWNLPRLESLHLGVFDLARKDILAGANLHGLRRLTLGQTRKNVIDLAPIEMMVNLERVHLTGQTKHIEVLGTLPGLTSVSLSSIKNGVKLGFVSRIKGLQFLRLICGGRADIAEVAHEGLRTLEIILVRGLAEFQPAAFPALRELLIEDQIRLTSLSFAGCCAKLEKLQLITCKGLSTLDGLGTLERLRELRLARTALDLDALLASGLPPGLRVFGFATGKPGANRAIRQRLDALGYAEGAQPEP